MSKGTTIKTKFAIGDTIYVPYTQRDQKTAVCPDCKGSKKWEITRHGVVDDKPVVINCEVCSGKGVVADWQNTGQVSILTVGSVRTDTAEETSYMCRETGIGSGSIYRESRCYASYGEADKELPALTAKAQQLLEDGNARTLASGRGFKQADMLGYYRKQILRADKDRATAEKAIERLGGER